MPDWRDDLTFDIELDEETGCLKSNGEWITTKEGLTEYGRRWYDTGFVKINNAILAVQEEIAFLEKYLAPDFYEPPDERDITLKLYERAQSDYAVLLEYKAYAEQYIVRRSRAEGPAS